MGKGAAGIKQVDYRLALGIGFSEKSAGLPRPARDGAARGSLGVIKEKPMKHFDDRHSFLQGMAAVAAIVALAQHVCAREEKTGKKTYTYKTVEKCEIKADVYGASAEGTRPVVIWIHGGALIMGHREHLDQALLGKMRKAGYTVVSIDYRLAPETKLPAILEDVQDACHWVRAKWPELFHIDPKRIAVMGGSAGGYLTLAAGFRVHPRPTALVSFWGYGDIAGAWYSRPDPFYARMPLVPKEEACGAVGGPVLSESSGKNNRHRYYLYCRQQGLWPNEVTGHDPDKEPRAFDAFCPIRNVTGKYPPTMLIHGTKDTDVPYEQSARMAQELSRQGVEHELRTIQDAGHGLAGAKPAVVAEVHDAVLAFLKKHLR
jgi:acetyl esterase/lipase